MHSRSHGTYRLALGTMDPSPMKDTKCELHVLDKGAPLNPLSQIIIWPLHHSCGAGRKQEVAAEAPPPPSSVGASKNSQSVRYLITYLHQSGSRYTHLASQSNSVPESQSSPVQSSPVCVCVPFFSGTARNQKPISTATATTTISRATFLSSSFLSLLPILNLDFSSPPVHHLLLDLAILLLLLDHLPQEPPSFCCCIINTFYTHPPPWLTCELFSSPPSHPNCLSLAHCAHSRAKAPDLSGIPYAQIIEELRLTVVSPHLATLTSWLSALARPVSVLRSV